jgi:hypothetical protein
MKLFKSFTNLHTTSAIRQSGLATTRSDTSRPVAVAVTIIRRSSICVRHLPDCSKLAWKQPKYKQGNCDDIDFN